MSTRPKSIACPSHSCIRKTLLLLVLLGCTAAVRAQSPPTIVKAFSVATIPLNGSATLTFTITNPNPATDLTGVSFTDNLPAGLIIANPDSLTPDPVLGTCDPTGTTGTITPAVNSITLTGGQIPANATCTFSIDVLTVDAGDQVNTTDAITSVEGGTGGTATATLSVVVPDLTITKTHTGNFLRPQTGVTYTIAVTNSGQGDTSSLITVSDHLPTGLTATAIDGGPNWNCTLSPLQCTRGDVLVAGASFEPITVTVNVAQDAPSSVTNTASVAGGTESNTSNNTASDSATTTAALVLTTQNTSLTVKAGSSGSAVLNVTANGAGLGPITFSCSGLPVGASCSFNPPSVSATSSVTMTIAVPKKGSLAPLGWRPPPAWPNSVILLMWLTVLSTAGMLVFGSRRAKKHVAALMFVSLIVGLALMTGCAEGGKSTLFNVTVTATSPTGGSVTTPVSLTVN